MILAEIDIESHTAQPVNNEKTSSGWISVPDKLAGLLGTVLGKSGYRARTGVFTGGLNAVFWLNILEQDRNILKIANINLNARKNIGRIETFLEKK